MPNTSRRENTSDDRSNFYYGLATAHHRLADHHRQAHDAAMARGQDDVAAHHRRLVEEHESRGDEHAQRGEDYAFGMDGF